MKVKSKAKSVNLGAFEKQIEAKQKIVEEKQNALAEKREKFDRETTEVRKEISDLKGDLAAQTRALSILEAVVSGKPLPTFPRNRKEYKPRGTSIRKGIEEALKGKPGEWLNTADLTDSLGARKETVACVLTQIRKAPFEGFEAQHGRFRFVE